MMGSVYERFREIGIYSSVGLAPGHIAWLFIAESCVYSVLGVVAGYLTGQVIAKVLIEFDLLGGFTLNYSSVARGALLYAGDGRGSCSRRSIQRARLRRWPCRT